MLNIILKCCGRLSILMFVSYWVAENMMLVFGISIGYSSPNTLTDKSTMIPRGGRGDASVLRCSLPNCTVLILPPGRP